MSCRKSSDAKVHRAVVTASIETVALFTYQDERGEPAIDVRVKLGSDNGNYESVLIPIYDLDVEIEGAIYEESFEQQRVAVAEALRDLADSIERGQADRKFPE